MKYKSAFRYALLGAVFGLLFPIIGTIIEINNASLPQTLENFVFIQAQKQLLWIIDTAPIFLGIFAGLVGIRQDTLSRQNHQLETEILTRKQAFEEIEKLKNNLDNQVKERTISLERKVLQLRASTEVGQAIASIYEIDTLLREVTVLISEQFGFYHTGIFLLDKEQKYAVLKSTNSVEGQGMLARNHKLKIDGVGIVSYTIREGTARIAQAVRSDDLFFDNPDLPDTRSELALPLITRGKIIGALDIQSREEKAFKDDDILVLQTMANLVAGALQTAQLFQQVEQSSEALRKVYGELSQEAWRKITEGRGHRGYHYIQGDVVPIDEQQEIDLSNLPEISIPIQIGEQTVGFITAHKSSSETEWTASETAIMKNISDQLSVALESARIFQDTQMRAAREQITGEVTTRIRETMDIDTIIKTASDEIRKALNLPEVVIRLGEPASNPKRGVTK